LSFSLSCYVLREMVASHETMYLIHAISLILGSVACGGLHAAAWNAFSNHDRTLAVENLVNLYHPGISFDRGSEEPMYYPSIVFAYK